MWGQDINGREDVNNECRVRVPPSKPPEEQKRKKGGGMLRQFEKTKSIDGTDLWNECESRKHGAWRVSEVLCRIMICKNGNGYQGSGRVVEMSIGT